MCRHISTVSDRPGYTFGYIPANNYRGPKPSVENRCPPSQLVVMRWLHICRSTKSRRVLWSPRTLPVADERASFRPLTPILALNYFGRPLSSLTAT
jgi:hypothetical protein